VECAKQNVSTKSATGLLARRDGIEATAFLRNDDNRDYAKQALLTSLLPFRKQPIELFLHR
jgi:hypothetical protein